MSGQARRRRAGVRERRTSALEREVALAAQAPLTELPALKDGAAAAPSNGTPPAVAELAQDKAKGLRIRYRSVAELIPYARNARTHSDAQVAQIAGSIREFGFVVPVVLDAAGGILAGHGRVMAAQLLKLPKVPTIAAAHLTEAQRRAYTLADNRLAESAGWDKPMLALELGELAGLAYDVRLIGFSDTELDEWLGRHAVEPGDLAGPADGAEKSRKQMTFTLDKAQAEKVKAALKVAKEKHSVAGGPAVKGNGTALHIICEAYMAGRAGTADA